MHILGIHSGHDAAAYFTRGSDEPCVVLTVDGVGDGISTAIWHGMGSTLAPRARWGRDGSLGWFYGMVTEALGWQHGDGEGTTMVLAAYGDPTRLADRLAPSHPTCERGALKVPHDFGRTTEWNRHGALQWHFHEADGIRRLTDEHWIVPDAGDSGLALGAALHAWHTGTNRPPRPLSHLSFGPSYGDDAVRQVLDARRLAYRQTSDPAGEAAPRDRIGGPHDPGYFVQLSDDWFRVRPMLRVARRCRALHRVQPDLLRQRLCGLRRCDAGSGRSADLEPRVIRP